MSKISLILSGFNPYLPLYSSIRELIFKLVSLDFVLTRHRVYSMTARIGFINYTNMLVAIWSPDIRRNKILFLIQIHKPSIVLSPK